MEGLSSLIFLAFLIAVFYFMLIRPQKKRVRQHQALVESVSIGDDVITIGGLHGTVSALDEETFDLTVSPGVNLRFVRSAIARKVTEETEAEQSEDDELAGDEQQ
ncbi:MAG: preprotein translocase subunit YajC [Actinomycetota bacterium]